MKISLSHTDWTRMNLSDARRFEVARAAFYLGFGFSKVQRLLDYGSCEERESVVSTAVLLGMSEKDVLSRETY